MFASQLLRILQTIPADVNYETSAFDTPKQKFTMTENQIGIIYGSNSYEKESDCLSFSASETLSPNCHGENPNSLALAIEDADDFWTTAVSQSPVLDNSTKTNCNEPGGSPVVGDHIPCHLNCFEKDAKLFVFDAKDLKDETQTSQEDVFSMIDDHIANCNEESKESETSSVLQPFESDWNPFMDKNVLECELPEFVVCYKESNIQMVKDIRIDEGLPAEDKILTESDKDDHACSVVLQPADEDGHGGTTSGPVIEFFVPDGFTPSYPEDNHNAADEFGTEEIEETKTAGDELEKRSSISSARLSEEFILPEAILDSSKDDESKVDAKPDEVPSLEVVLESLAVAFSPAQSKKDGPVSNVGYNSKVEGKAPETEDKKLNDQLASTSSQLANNEEKIKENASDPNPWRPDAPNNANVNSGHLSLSGHLQRGGGESSFSASSVPVSGLITYSGPIACSGSTSLRSDSSTTSTRSFAFPVLQTEWNSSPVRMEKAQKHKGWRHGIFCCRF